MAISRIETGKRVVTDFELKLFSSVLGLSMDDLTACDPSPVSSDPPRR
nr:MAG TPA: PrgX, peptide, inhibitor, TRANSCRIPTION.0A [Caudoviricetes sp.]